MRKFIAALVVIFAILFRCVATVLFWEYKNRRH